MAEVRERSHEGAVARTGETKPNGRNNDDTNGDTPRFKVRLSHPDERKKTVFSSISEKRARRFISNRYPRGEEAYLELPDGSTESYQHEREGERGEDAEQWAEFDPESWLPPNEAPPPGEAAWADVEA
jgi:hypothetical protein